MYDNTVTLTETTVSLKRSPLHKEEGPDPYLSSLCKGSRALSLSKTKGRDVKQNDLP